jgi:cell division protein FtsB
MSLILTSIIARFGTHLAIGAGLLVGFLAWQKRIEVKAVTAERVRVEETGNKIDAAAQQKREKIQRAPQSEIDIALRKYCRDC